MSLDDDYYREIAVRQECNAICTELQTIHFYDEIEQPIVLNCSTLHLYKAFTTKHIQRVHNKEKFDNYMTYLYIRFNKLKEDMKNDKKFKEFINGHANRNDINVWLSSGIKKYYTLYC